MDPFTTRKPTGPSLNSAYRLKQVHPRQPAASRPSDIVETAPPQAGTSSFDPSKPSFMPVKPIESFFSDSITKRRANDTPEKRRIQHLEDAMNMYNGSHQLQLNGFVDDAQDRSDRIQAQADKLQAHAERAQQQAEKMAAQTAQIQVQTENTQSQTKQAKEQAEKIITDLSKLKIVLRNDFRVIGSEMRFAEAGIQELTARLEAADRERSWMATHMRAKTLAEAESHELMARRLRESVLDSDGIGQLHGGAARLQLTDEPEQQQQESGTVQEPVEVEEPTEITEEEDEAKTEVPVVEDEESRTDWQPYAISQLMPLSISAANDETFTWEDIHHFLGGAQYSPGLYLTNDDSVNRILKGKTYWLLEGQFEPFAPKTPGQHGAKLTAFFNDTPTADGLIPEEEDYANVPLFICLDEAKGYTYLGTYSQPRYSDKLSHSELFQRVPESVLRYWASQLAEIHRPAWVTDQLIAQFWPAPTYTGPIPSDAAVETPHTGDSDPRDPEKLLEKRVVRSLEQFAHELRDWKKESQLKAQFLTEDALMEMWAKSDLDEEKGMRPWWEYLECVGFDGEFYERIVDRKLGKGKGVVGGKGEPGKNGCTTLRAEGGDGGEQRRDSAAGVPELELDESPIKEAKFKRTRRPAPGKIQGH